MLKSGSSLRDVNCVKGSKNETKWKLYNEENYGGSEFCINMMCFKAATSEGNYQNGGRKLRFVTLHLKQ